MNCRIELTDLDQMGEAIWKIALHFWLRRPRVPEVNIQHFSRHLCGIRSYRKDCYKMERTW